MLTQFVKHMSAHQDDDATGKKKMENSANDALMACPLMQNSDQWKHGSVLTRLTLQHWMGAEQHPMTIVVATDMLVNHVADDADRKNNEQQGTSDQVKGDNVVSKMTNVKTSFAQ